MKQIEMNQKTFGKETLNFITEFLPNAKYFVTVNGGKLIKDIQGNTIATWQKRYLKFPILVVWNEAK